MEYDSICEEKIKDNRTLYVFFKLTYYNTSSQRSFLDIFQLLKKLREKGLDVHVNWYYEKDDETMFEGGKELSEIGDLNTNLIEYNN